MASPEDSDIDSGPTGASPRLSGVTFGGAFIHEDDDDTVRVHGGFSRADIMMEICGHPLVKARGSHLTLNVYDRNGLIEQIYQNYSWDPNATWSIDVALTGEYPHIIIGDSTQCIYSVSFLDGFEQGTVNGLWGSDDDLFSVEEKDAMDQRLVNVTLEVPIGHQAVRMQWKPSDFVWRVFQPGLEVMEGQTPGTLDFRTSAGFLARSFDVSATGRWQDNLAGPAFLYPGGYSLDLQLERPALTPTKWELLVNVAEFDSQICRLDIEWSLCVE